MNKSYSVAQIARLLAAEFVGDGDLEINQVAPIDTAQKTDITFLSDKKYLAQLSTTLAGCVLVSEELKTSVANTGILVPDPYLAFAKVAQLFDSTPTPAKEIHPSVVIGKNVKLGNNVAIEAGCVIADNVSIADNVIIGANTVVGCDSVIGKQTRVWPNVSIYHGVFIGENCIIQSGAIIGSDGFGYANEKGVWVRIPQTGGVKIGNNVDIGANACIDRGALKDTEIGNGVKIDNLCHIAHNVIIGEHTAMAGMTGVAGSATIGKYCTFSGRSSVLGHLTIADKTHVTACSLINRTPPGAGVYSSGTGMQDNKSWRKNVARFRQLDDMAKLVKRLEKRINELEREPKDEQS